VAASPDQVVRNWFERVWNQADESAIDELFAPGGIGHGLENAHGAEIRGPGEFKQFARNFRSELPDIKIEVMRTLVQGDMCAAHCDVKGTHQPSKAPVHFTGMTICRVSGGQIQEAWNAFDFLTFSEQTGKVKRV
jgi:predicted SnoaL-like aldol condensation-catalyzing enzyme